MAYEIHTDHGTAGRSVESRVRYISAFEGRHADGWVISIDRKSLEGTLAGNDIDAPVSISSASPVGDLVLDEAEMTWVVACWMSLLKETRAEIENRIANAARTWAEKVNPN